MGKSTMRFRAHDRIIDLLVGQQLYTSADAAIRELLQNSEDACALQSIREPQYSPSIVVRYSPKENWVEVSDNGLGMNREALEYSFAAVGAPKEEVTHIRELLERAGANQVQLIAQFGIGVLSCFGVANRIVLHTKMDGQPGLSIVVRNYHEEFEELVDVPPERGTTIRLQLKPNGPMSASHVPQAVEQYARHAEHVKIEDVDKAERRPVKGRWMGAELPTAVKLNDAALRGGFLALDKAWDSPGEPLSTNLIICNGGFLVSLQELELLPKLAVGYQGEIDVKPGELTILLNREGFQHDERWQGLGTRLLGTYNRLLEKKIAEWEADLVENPASAEAQGIDRAVVILAHGPTRSVLDPDLAARIDRLLLQALHVMHSGSDHRIPLAETISRSREKGVVYFVREGEGPRQFQQAMQHGSSVVQVTEVAQTQAIRTAHLTVKGATVVRCRHRSYSINIGGTTHNIALHEADILTQQCQRVGLRCVSVNDATPEEVELGAAPESALVSDLIGLEESIRLVVLDSTNDPVIRDYAGRLLNCANPELREILRILPDAVGNPVRRALLQIYMDVSNYRFDSARRQVKRLLTDPHLEEQAQLSTGRLLRDYLRAKLQYLITDEPHNK